MIKLFRNIRKNLLNEGKTANYFKYAIGEIILVVIGILIALSINNWNSQRKDNRQEIYILKQLKSEFKSDSTLVYQFNRLTKGKVNQSKLLRNIVLNKKYKSGLDTVVINAFFIGRFVMFDSYTPTFDELIAAGKLNLVKSDTLKNLIKKYKNDLKIFKSFLFDESQQRFSNYNSHLYKYFEPQIMTYLWENGPNPKNALDSLKNYTTDIKGFINDPQTLYHINIVLGVNREMSNNYKRKINTIHKIIKKIETEISKHKS